MNLFSAIIFSDNYLQPEHELIKKRSLSSVPFAGRFRMVDFILSSLVNADVANVSVIPTKNYASLEAHLGRGQYWDLNHRNSGLRILSPFYRTTNNNEVFMARGKLDALRSVGMCINALKEEYVVICNANLVANIDFDKVFDAHLESGADITTVYADMESYSPYNLEATVSENGRITGFSYGDGDGQKKSISLNIYVMKKSLLMDIIREANAGDLYSFETYVLIKNVGKLNIMGYKHTEYARIFYTIDDYYNASMDILDSGIRAELFNSKRPIITRVRDSVPVLYRYNANIENSLIADGCKIDGTVRNSVIFRNVTVETGAVIENSVIMENTVIGKNCSLSCVITDKNVSISDGEVLSGIEKYPYVLTKGTKI